jgi:hypothetical protein
MKDANECENLPFTLRSLCRPSFPPSRHDWEVHREYFTQLYQDEERSLKEVMEIMKDRHHFHATYDPLGCRVTMRSPLAV